MCIASDTMVPWEGCWEGQFNCPGRGGREGKKGEGGEGRGEGGRDLQIAQLCTQGRHGLENMLKHCSPLL